MARRKAAVWAHGPPQSRCMGAWIVPRLIFPAFLSRLLRLFPPSEPLAALFLKRVELWSFRSGAPEIHFRGSPPQVVPREYLLFQALLALRVILARSPLPARAIRCPLLARAIYCSPARSRAIRRLRTPCSREGDGADRVAIPAMVLARCSGGTYRRSPSVFQSVI